MSNADFFRHLFLAAVTSGQVTCASNAAEVRHVMAALMDRYLDAAQANSRGSRLIRTVRSGGGAVASQRLNVPR